MSDIKMSDMFAVDIQAKQIHIKGGYTYSKISGMTTEEYAARAINTHDTLVAQNLALKAALFDIKQALHANPNQPKEVLFDCCATAFQIAEKAQEANKR